MVSSSMAHKLGWIYAVIALAVAVLECALCIFRFVHAINFFTCFAGIVAIVWVIFSIILIVGILKRNVHHVQAYRVFLFVGNALTLLLLIVTNIDGQVTSWNLEVGISLVALCLISFALFMLELWIVNGVIRYIEKEKEVTV